MWQHLASMISARRRRQEECSLAMLGPQEYRAYIESVTTFIPVYGNHATLGASTKHVHGVRVIRVRRAGITIQ